MASRARAALVGLAAFVALAALDARPAHALDFPIPDLQVRNGDWLSVGLVGLQEPGSSLAIVERFELGLGGASASAGLMLHDGLFSRRSKGANVSLSAKLTQTYGLTSWPVSMYAGPELSLGALPVKILVGVMFDVTRPSENYHPQLGMGFGF